jgi:enoyl-CoA hydratase/carnithine racemase
MGANDSPLLADDFVLLQRRDAIAYLQLNRPAQFNALSGAMMSALQASLDELALDESVRVVVISAGGKAFCAGHDLREMSAHPELPFYQALFAQCSRLMLTIQAMPQPVIARVHGLATAAGCQLVAMCDLAVASSEARFAVSGVNLGLFCATPSVALSRNLARKKAFEMLVTGEFISAAEALVEGLVNRVVAPAELDQSVNQLCASIVSKPAVAIALGKGLFYKQLEMGTVAAYQLAGQTMACNMIDAAAQEGTRAFIEKRPPRW